MYTNIGCTQYSAYDLYDVQVVRIQAKEYMCLQSPEYAQNIASCTLQDNSFNHLYKVRLSFFFFRRC